MWAPLNPTAVLSPSDHAALGFVFAAVFRGAISIAEVRSWADHETLIREQPPEWLIDFAFFDQPAVHLYEILRVVPDRELSKEQKAALIGIAYLRGRMNSTEAITLLKTNGCHRPTKYHRDLTHQLRALLSEDFTEARFRTALVELAESSGTLDEFRQRFPFVSL